MVTSVIALPQIVRAYDAPAGTDRIIVAQKEDPKKKKQPQKAVPKPQPPKAPPPQRTQQPQPPKAPPPQRTQQPQPPKGPPQQQKVQQPQPPKGPPPQQKVQQPPKLSPQQQQQQKVQQQPKLSPQQQQQQKVLQQPKLSPQQQQQQQQKVLQQPKLPPPQQQPQRALQQKGPQPKLEPQVFGKPKAPPASQFGNVKQLSGQRKEVKKGNLSIIQEPGNRTIIRQNNRLVIRNDDSARLRRWGDARFEVRGPDRYTIIRRGPYEIVNVTDANGRLIRRFRRGPDGREYILIDNRRRLGAGAAVAGIVALGLAMPLITIPRERYIVGINRAPPVLLYETLDAPPLVPIERAYTLDEIRDNVELRARVRSVDINTINFESGSWEISPDQIPQLQALADAMMRVITENPSTVFLLEGHTDAVGSPEDNISLSDRRAETVAEVLTTNFNVPPENLVTQGYGEQYLRVQTQGDSRENRRVEVRNVTGLMAGADGAPGGDPQGGPGGPPPGGQPPG